MAHVFGIVERAIEVAAIAHQTQTRKGTTVPYIMHPYSVGMTLAQSGCRDEVIAAGILHDVVEDTSLTLEDIETEFGREVADLVQGASEPDKSRSWEERKSHTIHFLKSASLEQRILACADKLHNIRSMREDYNRLGEGLWAKFSRGRAKQEWYYRSIIESLGSAGEFPLLSDLREEVELLFGSG